MIEYPHKEIVYTQIIVEPTNEVIDIKKIKDLVNKFKKSKCVENSQIVAEKLNLKCVEGFVFCIAKINGEVKDKVIRHCWNKIDEKYFDVTKDYIWSKNEILQEFIYFPISEFCYTEYDFEKGIFLSNAVEIAKEIDDLWQKELEE